MPRLIVDQLAVGAVNGNLSTSGGKVELVALNSGPEGEGFEFRAAANWHGLASPEAFELAETYPQVDGDNQQLFVPRRYADESETVAIGSRKVTDALLISMTNPPASTDLHPGRLGARAAWLSGAYIVREAAWRSLDAAPDEFSAGFRPTASTAGLLGEIYLSDSILNGAGYARHFMTDVGIKTLVDQLEKVEDEFIQHDMDDPCDGSCYRCLRDYSNSRLHPLLDWRLAVDLSRMLRTGSFDPATLSNHVVQAAATFAGALADVDLVEIRGRSVLVDTSSGAAWVIVHPLEAVRPADMSSDLAAAYARVEASYQLVQTMSWFDLTRTPGLVAQTLRTVV